MKLFTAKEKVEKRNKVEKVMREFKEGTLKDSHGNKITDRKQAIAIALSEAGLSKSDIIKEKACDKETKKSEEENIFESGNYDKIEKAEGYTEDQLKEMIEEHISKIVPDKKNEEVDEILKDIKKGDTIKPFETVRKTKQGEETHVSLTVSPIKNNKGEQNVRQGIQTPGQHGGQVPA